MPSIPRYNQKSTNDLNYAKRRIINLEKQGIAKLKGLTVNVEDADKIADLLIRNIEDFIALVQRFFGFIDDKVSTYQSGVDQIITHEFQLLNQKERPRVIGIAIASNLLLKRIIRLARGLKKIYNFTSPEKIQTLKDLVNDFDDVHQTYLWIIENVVEVVPFEDEYEDDVSSVISELSIPRVGGSNPLSRQVMTPLGLPAPPNIGIPGSSRAPSRASSRASSRAPSRASSRASSPEFVLDNVAFGTPVPRSRASSSRSTSPGGTVTDFSPSSSSSSSMESFFGVPEGFFNVPYTAEIVEKGLFEEYQKIRTEVKKNVVEFFKIFNFIFDNYNEARNVLQEQASRKQEIKQEYTGGSRRVYSVGNKYAEQMYNQSGMYK